MPRSDILENSFKHTGLNIQSTTIEGAVVELATNYRIKLTSNTTFYVNKTLGSNSFDGSTETKAFKTLQYALITISNKYDFNGHDVEVLLSSETYTFTDTVITPQMMSQDHDNCSLVIRGQSKTGTVLQFDSGFFLFNIDNNPTSYCIANLTFQGINNSGGLIQSSSGAKVELSNVIIKGTFATTSILVASSNGSLTLRNTDYDSISGANHVINAFNDGRISLTNTHTVLSNAVINVNESFINVAPSGTIFSGATFVTEGTVNCPRFSVGTGGNMQLPSYDLDYFPGNAPGVFVQAGGYQGQNYDNTNSGLNALNYQEAIDEISINSIRSKLTSDTTYYIDPVEGSDNSKGTTGLTAFQTIQKAFDVIQNDIDANGYKITISLAAGDYTGEGILHLPTIVGPANETCGIALLTSIDLQLKITGQDNLTSVRGFEIDHGGYNYSITNLKFVGDNSSHAIKASRNSYVSLSGLRFEGSYSDGVIVDESSTVILREYWYVNATFTSFLRVERGSYVSIDAFVPVFQDGYSAGNTIVARESFVTFMGVSYSPPNSQASMGGLSIRNSFVHIQGQGNPFGVPSLVFSSYGYFNGEPLNKLLYTTYDAPVNYSPTDNKNASTHLQAIDFILGKKADNKYLKFNSSDFQSTSTGTDSISIGINNTSSGNTSKSIGRNITSSANSSFGIGDNLSLLGSGSYIFGSGSSTTSSGPSSIIVGHGSVSEASNCLVLGNQSSASSAFSQSIGYRTTCSSYYGLSIGSDAEVTGLRAISIGGRSKSSASDSVSLGYQSQASGSQSISVGNNTVVSSSSGIGIGYEANTTGIGSVQLGQGNNNVDNTIQFKNVKIANSRNTTPYDVTTEVNSGTVTAEVGKITLVNSLNPVIVNAPSNPQPLDRFMVINSRANTNSTNRITVDFTGQTRHGATNSNRALTSARGRAQFMYVNSSIGWIDLD